MTHHEHDELALLLMMNQHTSSIDLVHEKGPDAICALFELPADGGSWYLEAGRRHIPAEIAGRVAEPPTEPARQGNSRAPWLDDFDRGCCISDLVPLEFDHKTLTYSGTIFWVTPGSGVVV